MKQKPEKQKKGRLREDWNWSLVVAKSKKLQNGFIPNDPVGGAANPWHAINLGIDVDLEVGAVHLSLLPLSL